MDWKDRHLALTGNKVNLNIKTEKEKKKIRFLFVLHSELTGYYRLVCASNIKQRSEQIANSAGFPVSIIWRTHNKIENAYKVVNEVRKTLPGRCVGEWYDCTWEDMADKIKENGLTL